MSLIQITDLSFAYDGGHDYVFKNASFQIDTDWKLGFTGRNGRGKTTLLKLLMGEYAYQGSISASVDFEYFPYPVADAGLDTSLVLESISPDCPYWMLRRELAALELDEDILYRPFSSLSNGEQTKVLLAVLFLKENSFLLIDEPTNHLDMKGRELVSRYLASKKGYILVSHDRAFLDGCVDHILSINRADIEVQRGNFSTWYMNKERRDSFELAENEKLKGEIKRLKETAREKAQWSDRIEASKIGQGPCDRGYIGHQAARMMKRSKSIEARQERAIEEKSKLLKNLETKEDLKISQLKYHSDRLLLLRDVSIAYGEKTVCSDVSFSVQAGDRVALLGSNGSGKSSLLKLICGEPILYSGVFERSDRLIISYVPQDSSFLSGSLSAYAAEREIDESLFKAILRKLDFSREQFEKDMRRFSAGQKKKVLIAASLCQKAHLHVWDEPMNYIDVISRMQLEELLLRFRPTLLFVEHDRAFCEKLATKTIRL